jgi:hypothetical protein
VIAIDRKREETPMLVGFLDGHHPSEQRHVHAIDLIEEFFRRFGHPNPGQKQDTTGKAPALVNRKDACGNEGMRTTVIERKTPVSSSLVKLYEQHAKECAEAAEQTDDPIQRVILLRMAHEWMQDAATIASTLTEPEQV